MVIIDYVVSIIVNVLNKVIILENMGGLFGVISEEDRENCDAFANMKEPCWIVKNTGDICKDEDCRLCPIYSNLSPFSDMKNFLKNHNLEQYNRTEKEL